MKSAAGRMTQTKENCEPLVAVRGNRNKIH